MSVEVQINVQNPRATTFEGVKVEVVLHNRGTQSYVLPGPEDLTGALTVDVIDSTGVVVLYASGLTHQQMMSVARVDPRPSLEELGPGQRWQWTIDLASYQYGVPAGRHSIRARYDYEPAGVHSVSNPILIDVSVPSLRAVSSLHDNPVLDGLAMIFSTASEWGGETYLRQHNHSRPLAAWYSERIACAAGAEQVLCASNSFFQTESFDPFFGKWVLWRRASQVGICFHESGQCVGPGRNLTLPEGCVPLHMFLTDVNQAPKIMFWNAKAAVLECVQVDGSSFRPVFSHRLPPHVRMAPVVDTSSDAIYLVSLVHGLTYERLDPDGQLRERRHLVDTRLKPYSCELEIVEGHVRGLFWDAPSGRTIEMIVVDLESAEEDGAIQRLRIENVPVRGVLRELAFDCAQGRFYLLVATDRGNLYCLTDGAGPVLVATSQDRFFPRVVAPSRVYLGFQQTQLGYRYIEVQRHGTSRKLRWTA